MKKVLSVILAMSLAIMVLSSWAKTFDSISIQHVDAGLKRALFTYASARALNAAISVAQGTEVAIEPGGVGVNFTPGQALDPINDLVEQFSTLMLFACVAFGIQKILISIGGYWLISLVLTSSALGWAWLYFRQKNVPIWLTKILVILLMIRFAIPMVTIGTDFLFKKFMATEYSTSQNVVDTASGQITEINPPEPAPPAEQGFFEGLKEKANALWSRTKSATDVKAHYLQLKQKAEQWTEHIIKLIVVFLLQSLIIPVLLIWILYAVVRGAFELPTKKSNVT